MRSPSKNKTPFFILISILAVTVVAGIAFITCTLDFGRWGSAAQPGAPRIVAVRKAQTTTVLADGRVLVVGGEGAPRSAELYDPATAVWSRAASPATGRFWHSATVLGDGRVFVAGGYKCSRRCTHRGPLRSAEIYDPATNAWTRVTTMMSARAGHIAVPLPNGHILVSGGHGFDPGEATSEDWAPELRSSEVYDPGRDVWYAVAPMNLARSEHQSAPLAHGRVIVAGGGNYLDPGRPRETFEIYDPTSDSWRLSPRASLGTIEWFAPLPDGNLLAMGSYLRWSEMYDMAAGEWLGRRDTPPPNRAGEPVSLSNGLVLVAGGTGPTGPGFTAVTDATLFDPSTGTWSQTGSMGIARGFGSLCGPTKPVFCEGHTSVRLQDGRVLVYGGRLSKNREKFSNPPNVITSEVYDPASGTWSPRGR